jgi:preprotein translocase subunit SecA
VDYILRDGEIRQIDEFTGRVVEDRHWPDGLQAALQAKEGLAHRQGGRILGSITLQHLLQLYPSLCGMTGTAQPAADELREIYGLDVVVIPPNRPCIRRDLADVVFTHRDAKTRALVREIRRVHASGRPILVGTLSVAESDELASALESTGLACEVLNARTDEREAAIIAEAGAIGALTISTNMAGRGTDIRLGGKEETDRHRVVELGGLYVIGTNRHESLRIDQQLRGRAGRQGDPGSTRFFLSLEDDLIARYGVERLIPRRLRPEGQDEPLGNPVIRREIARAQRIVEGQNFEIRRTLGRYSAQIEEQRKILQRQRDDVLLDRTPARRFASAAPGRYADCCTRLGEDAVHRAEEQATLFHMDEAWSDHLGVIADLREGIHLLRVGGQDPLTEFLHRAVASFREMQSRIDEAVVQTLKTAALTEDGIDLEREGLRGPSSTWTYLINDDPFRDQLGIQMTGNTGVAAATALYAGPLLILWGLYNRFLRRWLRRRGGLEE